MAEKKKRLINQILTNNFSELHPFYKEKIAEVLHRCSLDDLADLVIRLPKLKKGMEEKKE